MPLEDFHSHSIDVAMQIALLHAVDNGQMDDLFCPKCRVAAVTVRFTHPAPTEYRTWFICQKCGFRFRAQNSTRPKAYREDRIDMTLEKLDLTVLEKLQCEQRDEQ